MTSETRAAWSRGGTGSGAEAGHPFSPSLGKQQEPRVLPGELESRRVWAKLSENQQRCSSEDRACEGL